jgi:hypothetical protein
MFCNTTDDPSASFPNCRSMAFPKNSVSFPILSSRECCLLLRPPLLLVVVLPFLRCRYSSVSGLLMHFLQSWPFHRLFSSVRPLRVLGVMLSLVEYSLTKFPSLRATLAQRVMFLPAANSCRGPQFAWVLDFLKMFLLHHATVARRDTCLQAAANFFRDPQSPRVSSFGSPRCPAACYAAFSVL